MTMTHFQHKIKNYLSMPHAYKNKIEAIMMFKTMTHFISTIAHTNNFHSFSYEMTQIVIIIIIIE